MSHSKLVWKNGTLHYYVTTIRAEGVDLCGYMVWAVDMVEEDVVELADVYIRPSLAEAAGLVTVWCKGCGAEFTLYDIIEKRNDPLKHDAECPWREGGMWNAPKSEESPPDAGHHPAAKEAAG